jgi:signal peptidase I
LEQAGLKKEGRGVMFLLLLAFWVLLNGRITAEILILGVLICGVVYGWCCKVLGYEPKQGDVVVLNKTTADFLGEAAIVKRVIATGGQSVDIDYGTGTVYVDGEALEEDYTLEEMYQKGGHMSGTHFEVPEGEIFVMGDNRNGSTDSRDDRLGTIHEAYILGRAVCAIWPIGKLGLIS